MGADKLTGSLFVTVQMVYFATRVTMRAQIVAYNVQLWSSGRVLAGCGDLQLELFPTYCEQSPFQGLDQPDWACSMWIRAAQPGVGPNPVDGRNRRDARGLVDRSSLGVACRSPGSDFAQYVRP